MVITFVLHPWTTPAGWRWACYLADPAESEADPKANCINAGYGPTRQDANDDGRVVVYALAVLLKRLQIPCRVEYVDWGTDPFPALETKGAT